MTKQALKEEILNINTEIKAAIATIANNIRAYGDLHVDDGWEYKELKNPPIGGEDVRDVKAWFKSKVLTWIEEDEFMSDKEKEDIRSEYEDILD